MIYSHKVENILNRRVISLISLILIAGILAVSFYGFKSTLKDSSQSKNPSVIDCRGQTYTCDRSNIAQKPLKGCNKWAPWNSRSELDCNYTTQGTESVSLIADPANYITSKPTDSKYRTEFVSSTGTNPWDLDFLPTGKPIWTNKNGKVRYLKNGSPETILSLDVESSGTIGLLGLAIDPRFSENNYVYLFYAHRKADLESLVDQRDVNLTDFDDDPTTPERRDRFLNRVSRFKLTNQGLEDEKILIDNIPSSDHVSGGRIEFGPDGKLYITTSDANLLHKAADIDSLAGKILRANPNGSVPDDNPTNDSYVYSRAHKNPIGIAWEPETNNLYSTEHGAWRHDELNHIRPGENYGWYGYQCDEKLKIHYGKYQEYYDDSPEEYFNNTSPSECFRNWTLAPGGATFVNDPGHPWHGDLFIAGLRSKHLVRVKFEEGKPTDREIFYISNNEPNISLRLRDVEYQDGSLHVIGDRRGYVKLTPKPKGIRSQIEESLSQLWS